MAEFFIELLSEEIPARMQQKAIADFERLLGDGIKAAGLDFNKVQHFVTPRRMAVVFEDLPLRQPDVIKESKGPKVGAPEKALEGFRRASGLSSIDQAEVRETPKGLFYFLVEEISGRPMTEVLSGVVLEALKAMPWPKSMRWGGNRQRWVRPLHSIIALFDGQIIEGQWELGEETLSFGRQTQGPRFPRENQLSADIIVVENFADYRSKLEAAAIELDSNVRSALIQREAAALCQSAGVDLKEDKGLLAEVAGLVECPQVMMGTIDDEFMGLPDEVLSTSMKEHQKYFSTIGADGKLAKRFVFVANKQARDDGATILAGNERVLASRLSDARFFWDQDRECRLESRSLEPIVFQKALGTVAQKVARLEPLSAMIAGACGWSTAEARRAAALCKADLPTGMVGEFPELQGVMGRYYALHDGESDSVANAIADHYAPAGPSDPCPRAPISIAVALADKVDTLVGFFGIKERPRGSRDPFALRRAALGVIRLITENGLRLPLEPVLAKAYALYGSVLKTSEEEMLSSLMGFFADRVKVVLRDRGVRHDLVSAVFSAGKEDDFVRLLARVESLRDMLESQEGINLLAAYRRAANIVRIEEKKDRSRYDTPVDQALLDQAEEKALFSALVAAVENANQALKEESFAQAMSALAKLRPVMDSFFDSVTVNSKDERLRGNRLALLSMVGQTLGAVADFSKLEA